VDWSEFWIEHLGERRDAGTFGPTFLPELLRVIRQHAPQARRFLEWGTGISTLLFARLAGERQGSVVTIDPETAYARSVMTRLGAEAPVRLITADLTGPKLSQEDPELNYSTLPLSLGGSFDFIFIDGRRRVECAMTAFVLAHPGTIVVLHDYRRARYQPVSVLFETLEAGEHFRVMRQRPELARFTEAEGARLVRELSSGSGQP
jgi:predicted O-methyltransferase YrrM